MPKDKQGNQLTWKEFMHRWKKGIEGITPVQQIKTQLNSTKIMLVGLIGGLGITFLNIRDLWWLTLILVGGLFNTVVQYLALKQKYNMVKSFQKGGKKDVVTK